MTRRIVIVESPYSGDIARNERYLSACLRDCIKHGEAPFASHAIYTRPGVLDDTDPDERALGITLGFRFHRFAHALVVYGDLGVSRGMKLGIENAENYGIQALHRRLGGEWEQA